MEPSTVTNPAKPSVSDVLDVEFAFTGTYKTHQQAHPAIREAHCLQEQFPAICLPPQPGDLFVGRIRYRGVGFTPQFRQALDAHSKSETVGYYCEPQIIFNRLAKHELESNEQVSQLLAFWQENTTHDKIKARFTPAIRKSLWTDDYANESGVVFPLYRMAGANMDFDKLMQLGIPGLQQEITHHLELASAESQPLYEGMLLALDVLVRSVNYYIDLLDEIYATQIDGKRRDELNLMIDSLTNLIQSAPQNLHEAIQLMILYSMHANLYANYGRMDVYFGDFYADGVDNGRFSQTEALNMLLSLWQMFPSYAGNPSGESETRVFIGGRGRRNVENADRFGLLAMEASRIHRQPYPQLSLRMYKGMNSKLKERALDLIGEGLTYPILYNDDINIPAVMSAFEVDETMAEQYTPYSCGEYVMQSYSFGTPSAIINLPQALEIALRNGHDPNTGLEIGLKTGYLADFDTFDDLFNAYAQQVEYFTELAADVEKIAYDVVGEEGAFLYFSMLHHDCIGKGKAIFAGGLRHLGGTYETYGNVTAADSLTAIKTQVYEEKTIDKETLMAALNANFDGFEQAQQLLLDAPKFGNDDDVADDIVVRVHEHVTHTTRNQAKRVGLDSFLVVVINNIANVVLGRNTGASANGRLAHTSLTNAYTAMNGMEKNGITALFNSILKLDPNYHAGAVHNLKFSPRMFKQHRPQLEALLDTYFEQGGTQAMITVVSREDLLAALENPENYKHLLVRTGGFSARFVELAPDAQQEILNRTLW